MAASKKCAGCGGKTTAKGMCADCGRSQGKCKC